MLRAFVPTRHWQVPQLFNCIDGSAVIVLRPVRGAGRTWLESVPWAVNLHRAYTHRVIS